MGFFCLFCFRTTFFFCFRIFLKEYTITPKELDCESEEKLESVSWGKLVIFTGLHSIFSKNLKVLCTLSVLTLLSLFSRPHANVMTTPPYLCSCKVLLTHLAVCRHTACRSFPSPKPEYIFIKLCPTTHLCWGSSALGPG